LEPTRQQAWETLTQYTKSEALLRHALAVEASTASYARRFGEDEELWRVTALLHDFDYEIHPTLDQHPQDGAPILRERGYSEELIHDILTHADHLGLARETPLQKALYAVDEATGFASAVALVRPDKRIASVTPQSFKKKMKDKAFARAVSRDDMLHGAELLGVPFEEHIEIIVEAMTGIADELGLAGQEGA
jgi:putative nucleotidyltransferase with HDIG domain